MGVPIVKILLFINNKSKFTNISDLSRDGPYIIRMPFF